MVVHATHDWSDLRIGVFSWARTQNASASNHTSKFEAHLKYVESITAFMPPTWILGWSWMPFFGPFPAIDYRSQITFGSPMMAGEHMFFSASMAAAKFGYHSRAADTARNDATFRFRDIVYLALPLYRFLIASAAGRTINVATMV